MPLTFRPPSGTRAGTPKSWCTSSGTRQFHASKPNPNSGVCAKSWQSSLSWDSWSPSSALLRCFWWLWPLRPDADVVHGENLSRAAPPVALGEAIGSESRLLPRLRQLDPRSTDKLSAICCGELDEAQFELGTRTDPDKP